MVHLVLQRCERFTALIKFLLLFFQRVYLNIFFKIKLFPHSLGIFNFIQSLIVIRVYFCLITSLFTTDFPHGH